MPRQATVSRHLGLKRRVSLGLAALLGVLLPLAGVPGIAMAQGESNGPAAATNPPTIAGQLTRVSGTVSFHTASESTWQPADPNYPITSGNALWTQPGAGASVVFAGNRIAMDQGTELDIGTLDQHRLVVTVPQGTIFLHMRGMQSGDEVSVATPRGNVTIGQDGVYEIAAGDQATPTRVTVLQGAAQLYGTGVSAVVQQGQTATITGDSQFAAAVGPAQQDPFLTAQIAAETPPPPPAGVAPPPVVAQMTGGDELADTGTWQNTPQYGAVWYPPVASSWVPYREGHWAWVAPWGWTWVDDAPWGFAPFHYGRWLVVGGRWGWVPVVPGAPVLVAPPIYAPALVAFFGIGGVGVSIGIGQPVGWVPLAPFEPYHPWYHASPRYIREVNIVNVRNINRINVTNVYNTTTVNRFVNHNAVTVVPGRVMVGSRQVGRNLQHVPPAQFAAARPLIASPMRPTPATMGLSPSEARRFGMAPVPPQRVAPGPMVRPIPVGAPVPLRPRGGAPVLHPLITRPPTNGPVTNGPHGGPGAPPARAFPAAQHPPMPLPPHAPGQPVAGAPARGPQVPHPPASNAPIPQRPAPQRPAPQTGAQRTLAPAQVPHPGAPGPAIAPHPQGALPSLRPVAPQPHAQPQVRPQPQPQYHPQPQPQVRPQPQPQYHPQPQPQVRPQPQPQYHPQPQPQVRPQPQLQYHPQPQPQYHPQPQPQYHPQPQPRPQVYHPPPPPRPAPAPRPAPHACPAGHPGC